MSNILVLLWIVFTIGAWIIYHKIFRVYYFDLFHGLMKEIICSAFIGFILARLSLSHYKITAILLIIAGFALSGRITAPSLKKAIPIIFTAFAVIICVAGISEKHSSDLVNPSSTDQSISEQMESWLSLDEETEEAEDYEEYYEFGAPEKAMIYESLDTADLIDALDDSSPDMDEFQDKRQNEYTDLTTNELSNYLIEMGYIGDVDKCTMSTKQASAFAAILKNVCYPVVKAALFDGGNGIPLLWVAHGESERSVGTVRDLVLDADYGDQIYAFNNGNIVECPWMTTVLRAGENGVIVQSWTPRESEFGVNFRMYHMTNGLISDTPFATGSYDPVQGAYLNDRQVGWGGNVDVWDLYNMAESDLKTLLDASSWASNQLNLTGKWIDGQTMCSLLESYAQVLNGGSSTSVIQPANAAYRAILDELYTRYGGPVEHRNGEMGEEPSYTGVCGGYLADVGGGDGPELIVAFAYEGEYGPQSFIRIYTWNGTTAVLAEEYQVLASANGRAWETYGLYQDENGYAFFITEEYLFSYDYTTGTFYPGDTATTYYSLNGLQMQGCNPYYDAKERSEAVIGYGGFIRINNYSELYNRLT